MGADLLVGVALVSFGLGGLFVELLLLVSLDVARRDS